MITKTFEVRDRCTFVPVIAIKLEPGCERDRYILARAGYGISPGQQAEYVQLVEIVGGRGRTACDIYDWDDRTLHAAHRYIKAHFDELPTGAVVDVRFILGETAEPVASEAEAQS